MQQQVSYDKLIEKWAPVLDEESAGTIKDHHRKAVTAAILENQEIALKEEGMMTEAAPANNTSSAANWNCSSYTSFNNGIRGANSGSFIAM